MTNPTFFNQPPSTWNIIDYLNQHDPASPSYDHQHFLDKWIKALISISSDAKSTPEQRDKAQLLKDKYRQQGRDSDRVCAKEWLAGFQPSKKKKPNTGSSINIYKAPINITQGTFENSIINSTINQSGKRNASDDLEGNGYAVDNESIDEVTSRADESKQKESIPSAPAEPPRVNEDPAFKEEFVAAYKAMARESKYLFTTGRILEDVLFENASALTKKSIAHLWIVDIEDKDIKLWFKPEELQELKCRLPPMPELDEYFLASMARFSHASTADEFRRIVEEVPYRPKDEPYDRVKHFDAAWVNIVILSMLSILESPNNLLHYPNLCEGWYDCNPWSFLIDQCLLGLNGVLVQRKEILCLALKMTTPTPVRRFDAIIHTLAESPVLEYGAIEVAKSFQSVQARKWMDDSGKVVIALKAMLGRLKAAVGGNEETVERLQVCGMMNAGVRMQVVRMGSRGNVDILERGRVKTLPTEVEALRAVFGVMMGVVMFKKMIQNCVEVVKGYNGLSGTSDAAKTKEEFMEELAKQYEL